MADARSIIEGQARRITELENANRTLGKQLSDLSAQADARIETLEQTLFVLLSAQLDNLRQSWETHEDAESREAIEEAVELWSNFQAQVSPKVFARTYKVDPYTGEPLEQPEALEAFLAKPRIFSHPGD